MPGTPVVVWIEHQIHPQNVESYLTATLDNAAQTALEPGNLRFDVLSDPTDPHRFILYEVYVDKAAQQAHLASDHFQAHMGSPQLANSTSEPSKEETEVANRQ